MQFFIYLIKFILILYILKYSVFAETLKIVYNSRILTLQLK